MKKAGNNCNTWTVGFAGHGILRQANQASREKGTSSGNVRIIEQVIGGCKNQLVEVARAGIW